MSSNVPAQFPQRLAWLVMPAVVLGALVIAGWLWWLCYCDPRIRFLTPQAPAEWIVFPKPAGFDGRTEVELSVQFRQRWNLNSLPARAVLTYRAFTNAVVSVNGAALPRPAGMDGHDWKSPLTIDVTPNLKTGPNEIVVSVGNKSGPPALWAWLDAGGLQLISDDQWEASYAGSVWRPARLASKPLLQAHDGTAQDFSDLSIAWRTRWPTLLGLAGLSALLVVGWPWWVQLAARRKNTARWAWLQDPARMVLAGAIVFWIALFWHNLDLLPRESGFDAPAHSDYIRYIMERHSLPLADEGGTMYNPPLYYVICAGLLGSFSLPVNNPLSSEMLRGFALVAGIVHLLLMAGSLRFLFPGQARIQAIGLLLAAALPPNLYIAHYITNEWLVAMLVTGTIYLCLRLLRSPRVTAGECAAVGTCLGAALLTKFTALLVAPFVVGAVVIKVWGQPQRKSSDWLKTIGVLALTCGAVCGWHYLRVWRHFGQPLVGAWDAKSGFHWWQDQGYLTFSHFLGFGEALWRPAFSARTGFWDGLYSTLWADGLCGGRVTGDFRPPWDYALMAPGCWLAIGPMLAILAGAGWSLWRFVRQPTPERLILNGLGFGFALAVAYMDLKVPCYGQLKAFYGLVALLPVCAFGAEAWDAAGRKKPWAAGLLGAVLGMWALTSFATYWISPAAAQTHILLGSECADSGQLERSVVHYNAALKEEPGNAVARSQLASSLEALGRSSDAREQIEQNLANHPDVALCHLQFALIAQAASQWPAAVEHTRRALTLAPDCVPAHSLLVQQLQQLSPGEELIVACREGLRVDPGNPEIHFTLGVILATKTDTELEAREHLHMTARLAPVSVPMLNHVAWMLATHASSQVRDGALAVELAGKACQLTENRSVMPLLTLAAAQAETGRYEEAASTALLAEKLATDAGQAQLSGQCRNFASWFHSGHPFRQPTANAGGDASPK